MSGQAVGDNLFPHEIAVALDDRVSIPLFPRLFRIQRGVNAAVDHPRAALACEAADFIPAQGVARVNADTHDIPRGDCGEIDRLERLIDDDWIAPCAARGRRQHVQPARCDHGDPKRNMTRIDQMNACAHSYLAKT
jgi:hypothetical protein